MKIFIKVGTRYLFSRKQFSAINIISFLSVTGIALGVAALIIVLSIFSGFNELAEQQLSSFDPHIRITSKNDNSFIIKKSLIKSIKSYRYYKNHEKIIKSKVLAISNSGLQVFDLLSYSSPNSSYYSELFKNYIIKENSRSIENNLYLGYKIADALDKMSGDKLNLTSPQILDKSLLSVKPIKNLSLELNGLIYSNIKNYDAELGFAHENEVRKLALIPNTNYSYLDIRLKDKRYTDNFKEFIKDKLPQELLITDWKKLNFKLLQIMQFERIATFLILGIIILIAVFNVLTSLTMTVLEKQKDIGLMRAIGSNKSDIQKIFLAEGLIIGVISTSIGVLIGLLFCYLQINYYIIKLDTNKYIIDALPINITFFQIASISIFSIVLSMCSSIIPARRASKINIIEALREE